MKLIRFLHDAAFCFGLSICRRIGAGRHRHRNSDGQDHRQAGGGRPGVLLEPMSGMSEVGHATTDAQGRYSLNLPGQSVSGSRDTPGRGVLYRRATGRGTGDISVYDVAAKVKGVTIAEHVTGIETDNGQLRVVERYDIHNASTPPTHAVEQEIIPSGSA